MATDLDNIRLQTVRSLPEYNSSTTMGRKQQSVDLTPPRAQGLSLSFYQHYRFLLLEKKKKKRSSRYYNTHLARVLILTRAGLTGETTKDGEPTKE